MRNIFVITFFALLLTSCGASISDVKVGMTEAEVTEILGTANHQQSSSNSSTINGVGESHSVSTWEYDGEGKIEFEDGVVVTVEGK